MITTLFIDIDNTLLDFAKCSESSIIKGFSESKLEFTENIMPTFHEINNRLWQQIESGTLTRDELHKIRFKLVFDKLNIDYDGPEFEKQFIHNIYESHDIVEGAYEFLEYLSKKYILCAASNSTYEQQHHRLECADMLKYFKHIFVSESIGFAKPELGFFEECQRLLGGTPKDEMMIIGDSLTADIAGGLAFNIKTCWFNFFKSDEQSNADYRIDNLMDIKNIL